MNTQPEAGKQYPMVADHAEETAGSAPVYIIPTRPRLKPQAGSAGTGHTARHPTP